MLSKHIKKMLAESRALWVDPGKGYPKPKRGCRAWLMQDGGVLSWTPGPGPERLCPVRVRIENAEKVVHVKLAQD